MAAVARERVAQSGCGNIALALSDARALCFSSARFDALFFSFTLELFVGAVAPVLTEATRVLRPAGRVGVVAMDDTMTAGLVTPLYKWFHQHFPHVVDCAPIDVVGVMRAAGMRVESVHTARLWTLPVKTVIGSRPTA
jgi:demethylmenaquinone methyltransferase/2-methoxy-6-polyprenyl-1,4-benzoquinol methylase